MTRALNISRRVMAHHLVKEEGEPNERKLQPAFTLVDRLPKLSKSWTLKGPDRAPN
jgi:hypothetical protein